MSRGDLLSDKWSWGDIWRLSLSWVTHVIPPFLPPSAQVGSKGMKVSLSLRQRISLARTLLRNTPVVVLDDPTSAQEGYMVSQLSNMLQKWQFNPFKWLKAVRPPRPWCSDESTHKQALLTNQNAGVDLRSFVVPTNRNT